MDAMKQQLLALLRTYNQGRPVSYPVLDRKMMLYYPELVKDGKLGAVLDELVTAKLIEQVAPSIYKLAG